MSRRLRPLAALAMVGLISAGCANAPAATSTGDSTATHDKAVRFAECMRDNGVTEFPDPDASGTFKYGIKAGSSLDPSTAAWKRAIAACKDLEPPGALGGGQLSAQELRARLEFAQCMRDHGVTDFPDPAPDGPLIDVRGARSIPGFQAAVDTCRDLLAAASGNQ